MKIPDKVYDALKWIVCLLLPAMATLLSALTAAWGWDIPLEAILKTVGAVETFIGAVIGISCLTYEKGGNG